MTDDDDDDVAQYTMSDCLKVTQLTPHDAISWS